jgi:tetratricopeptide (TPR) repeat protein
LLRWNDTGASSYTVAIVSGGETVWNQPGVTGSSIRYPDGAPALQPDTDYLLTVQDGTHTSGDDPSAGLGFQVLSEAERAIIEERRDEILALSSLDSPARDFALAVYYATWQAPADETEQTDGRGLWGEAGLLLESVAQTKNEPAVHLWMGDVLAAMKLSDEAEAAYRDALESARTLGDLESQAAAHAGLWRAMGVQDHLEQALALYEELGDEECAEALRGR